MSVRDSAALMRDKIQAMKITEIKAENILSKSQGCDYALNPYVRCRHDFVCHWAVEDSFFFQKGGEIEARL